MENTNPSVLNLHENIGRISVVKNCVGNIFESGGK